EIGLISASAGLCFHEHELCDLRRLVDHEPVTRIHQFYGAMGKVSADRYGGVRRQIRVERAPDDRDLWTKPSSFREPRRIVRHAIPLLRTHLRESGTCPVGEVVR